MFPQKQKSTNVYLCVDALVCLLKEKKYSFLSFNKEMNTLIYIKELILLRLWQKQD